MLGGSPNGPMRIDTWKVLKTTQRREDPQLFPIPTTPAPATLTATPNLPRDPELELPSPTLPESTRDRK